MQKLFKIPLIFLFIASCIGLFLRYQLVAPVNGIVYSYVLHAHSHVMFLGWIFNVLMIAFTTEFVEVKGFKALFWFLQCCVVGMLISFPLQGYGGFSITFSSLHTFGAFAFIILFFRSKSTTSSPGLTLARAAMLFFVLSSIGPFFLGYLKANGLDHSNLYRFSIYFYLHFQYNGFFFFGILSLFMKLLEGELSAKHLRKATLGCYILIFSCIPAYFLSVLWSRPPFIFNSISFVSALAQLIGCWFLFPSVAKFLAHLRFKGREKLLFSISFAALALKSGLQLISAIPAAAVFANEFRSIVIAYLHLALLGFISLFLIAWLMRKGQIGSRSPWAVRLILAGFIGSETLLVITPWKDAFLHLTVPVFNLLILLFSVLMVFGIGMMLPVRRIALR